MLVRRVPKIGEPARAFFRYQWRSGRIVAVDPKREDPYQVEFFIDPKASSSERAWYRACDLRLEATPEHDIKTRASAAAAAAGAYRYELGRGTADFAVVTLWLKRKGV